MKNLIIAGIAVAGATVAFGQTSVPAGNITTDTIWNKAGSPYILEGAVYVTGSAQLTINPGVIVRGQPRTADKSNSPVGDPGSLIITQDGMINAAGTVAEPIIFTTAAVENGVDGIPDDADTSGFLDAWTVGDAFYDADPAGTPLGPLAAGAIPGATGTDLSANTELWGGLVILGRAPTNLGITGNATAKVGNIEGLPETVLTEYGGNLPNDNSGVLRYVSVRHGGSVLGDANEVNGITLGGVGYGTTIEYCEVYCTWDDGVEVFGGTVNLNHMVVTYAGDDQFDGDQGWTGQNQFLIAVLPNFGIGSGGGDKGFEFDGDDSDVNLDFSSVNTPFAQYTVYNATIVGSGNGNGEINYKSDYSGGIYNTIVVNTGASDAIIDGTSKSVVVDYCTFDDVGAGTAAIADVAAGSNNVVELGAGLKGEDPSTALGLDYRPAFSFSGVASDLATPNGIEAVSYRGAIDPSAPAGSTWTAGWTVLSKLGITVD